MNGTKYSTIYKNSCPNISFRQEKVMYIEMETLTSSANPQTAKRVHRRNVVEQNRGNWATHRLDRELRRHLAHIQVERNRFANSTQERIVRAKTKINEEREVLRVKREAENHAKAQNEAQFNQISDVALSGFMWILAPDPDNITAPNGFISDQQNKGLQDTSMNPKTDSL